MCSVRQMCRSQHKQHLHHNLSGDEDKDAEDAWQFNLSAKRFKAKFGQAVATDPGGVFSGNARSDVAGQQMMFSVVQKMSFAAKLASTMKHMFASIATSRSAMNATFSRFERRKFHALWLMTTLLDLLTPTLLKIK